MQFSDAELNAFERDVLQGAWAYQKAKGRVDGNYPSSMLPSEIHKRLFKGPPKTPDRQALLNALDKKHKGLSQTSGDYRVTLNNGQATYSYDIDNASDQSHARTLGISKYIKENLYGHKTSTLVNSLIRQGKIVIDIEQVR